jgi:hypothetical protein
LDGAGDEIGVLAGDFDGVFGPVDVRVDAAIAGNVFRQVDAVGEQEESAKLQVGI